MSNKFNTLAVFIVSAAIASLLAGCGGNVGSASLKNSTKRSLTAGSTIDSNASGGGLNDAEFGASVGTAGGELIRYDLAQEGTAEVTITAPARSILRVRFIPGDAVLVRETAVGWENYQGYYAQLAIAVAVGTREVSTALLSNGLTSAKQSSAIIDFSNMIGATECAPTDTSCRKDVTITVRKPRYDYHCYNWGHTCPNSRVESSHAWSGVLEIQTDDTVPL